MITRRAFMALVSGGLLAAPLAVEAQQVEKRRVPRIGVTLNLTSGLGLQYARAFEEGLRDRGYVPNRNLMIEYRSSGGKPELTPEVIDELVRLNVDVFVVGNNLAALALQRAAPTTPIVLVVATNPVGAGIAQSLAHPGGTITGLTWEAGPEMWGKSLNLFRDMLPPGSHIAVLWNAASPIPQPYLAPTEDAAKQLGVPLVHSPIQSPEELERAFALMVEGRPRGVLVVGDPVLFQHRSRVNELRYWRAGCWRRGRASVNDLRVPRGIVPPVGISALLHSAQPVRRAPAWTRPGCSTPRMAPDSETAFGSDY